MEQISWKAGRFARAENARLSLHVQRTGRAEISLNDLDVWTCAVFVRYSHTGDAVYLFVQ